MWLGFKVQSSFFTTVVILPGMLLSNTGHCHVMVIKLSYTVKFWQQSAIVLQAASWIPQPQPEIFFINPVRISEVVGIPSQTDAVFMLGENGMVHFEPY